MPNSNNPNPSPNDSIDSDDFHVHGTVTPPRELSPEQEALRLSVLARIENVYVSYDGDADTEAIHRKVQSNPFIIRFNKKNKFIHRGDGGVSVQVISRSEQERIKDKTVDVLSIEDSVRQQVAKELHGSIAHLRDELVLKFAPLSLSVAPAIDEAVQILNLATDGEVKATSFSKLSNIYEDLLLLKYIDFVGQTLGLDADLVSTYREHYLRRVESKTSGSSSAGDGGVAQVINALKRMGSKNASHSR